MGETKNIADFRADSNNIMESKSGFQATKRPIFSIITPVFNHQNYIGYMIESVLGQDFESYELILVDDFSSDDSVGVIKSYIDSNKVIESAIKDNKKLQNLDSNANKIKLIRHEYNRGINAAINTAFTHSSGEYLIFCGGDDMLESNILTRINSIINDIKRSQKREIIALECELNIIDENNNITRERHFEIAERLAVLHRMFLISACLTSTGLVINRSYFEKMYPLPLAMCNHQDTYMQAKLCLWGEVDFIKEKFVRYRQAKNHQSISNIRLNATIVRENYEVDSIMQVYLDFFLESKNVTFLKEIFAKEIERTNIQPHENAIEFFLGRMALESSDVPRQFWGYHTIMNVYNDEAKSAVIRELYGFTFKDLVALSTLFKDEKSAKLRKKYLQYRKRFNIMIILCLLIAVLFFIFV